MKTKEEIKALFPSHLIPNGGVDSVIKKFEDSEQSVNMSVNFLGEDHRLVIEAKEQISEKLFLSMKEKERFPVLWKIPKEDMLWELTPLIEYGDNFCDVESLSSQSNSFIFFTLLSQETYTSRDKNGKILPIPIRIIYRDPMVSYWYITVDLCKIMGKEILRWGEDEESSSEGCIVDRPTNNIEVAKT